MQSQPQQPAPSRASKRHLASQPRQLRSAALALGLLIGLSGLGACVTPSTPLPDSPQNNNSQNNSSGRASGTSSAAPCELNEPNESALEPLTTPENEPVFEQFNFLNKLLHYFRIHLNSVCSS